MFTYSYSCKESRHQDPLHYSLSGQRHSHVNWRETHWKIHQDIFHKIWLLYSLSRLQQTRVNWRENTRNIQLDIFHTILSVSPYTRLKRMEKQKNISYRTYCINFVCILSSYRCTHCLCNNWFRFTRFWQIDQIGKYDIGSLKCQM